MRTTLSDKNHFKYFGLLATLLCFSIVNAQHLLDTVPQVFTLSEGPQPKILPAGQPLTYPFVPKATNGEALITTYTKEKADQILAITDAYSDKNGNIWFTTNGEGIGKYDGKTITIYKQKNGLAIIVCSVLPVIKAETFG